MAKNTPNTIEDFWKLVKKTDNCWLWQGKTNTEGYGSFMFNGKRWRVHRFSFSLKHELISGLVIHHKCEIKNCVNPKHLKQVTDKYNILAGTAPTAINARKTYCKKGHKYTESNTYRYKDGRRDCRICMAIRMNDYYDENKERILRHTKEWYERRKLYV